MIKCITPTPRSWSQADVTDAFEIAAQLGQWVSLSDPIDWAELLTRDDNDLTNSKVYAASLWQTHLIREHKLNLFLQIDPYPTPRTGRLGSKLPTGYQDFTFANEDIRRLYLQEVLRRIAWYRPQIVCVAMEINSYGYENPGDWLNW